MKRWLLSLKERFWDNTPGVLESSPGMVFFSPGRKRPLRLFVEWAVAQAKDHAPAWIAALAAVVASVAAVIALLR